jgi:hypothetical protein
MLDHSKIFVKQSKVDIGLDIADAGVPFVDSELCHFQM